MPHFLRLGTFLMFSLPFTLLWGQLEDWDTDQDAMPNGWEFYRNLDLNDQKDAWSDLDKDGVCNLFEYFLGTDPQDPYQPIFLPYRGTTSLVDFINAAPRGVIIQLPEGNYPLNYLYDVQQSVPRLMIQGGWNQAFTEYDPCKYPTILDGQNQGAILDYFIVSENSGALILDGLTITNGSEGAVKFASFRPKVQLVISNSIITKNQASRFDAIVHFEDGPFTIISDFILVNSTLAGNQGTGINVVQNANHTNLKVLHSLITDNQFSENDAGAAVSGYGLHFQPMADSSLHVQIANSVLWGNANADVFQDNPDLYPVDPDSQYNIYGRIDQLPETLTFYSVADRFTDPQLIIQAGDYRFLPNGPTQNAGIDIGVVVVPMPNLGPDFCAPAVVKITDREVQNDGFLFFPNPVYQKLHLQRFQNKAQKEKVQIINALGQMVWEGSWPADLSEMQIPVHQLVDGTYQIRIASQNRTWISQFIKLSSN